METKLNFQSLLPLSPPLSPAFFFFSLRASPYNCLGREGNLLVDIKVKAICWSPRVFSLFPFSLIGISSLFFLEPEQIGACEDDKSE